MNAACNWSCLGAGCRVKVAWKRLHPRHPRLNRSDTKSPSRLRHRQRKWTWPADVRAGTSWWGGVAPPPGESSAGFKSFQAREQVAKLPNLSVTRACRSPARAVGMFTPPVISVWQTSWHVGESCTQTDFVVLRTRPILSQQDTKKCICVVTWWKSLLFIMVKYFSIHCNNKPR